MKKLTKIILCGLLTISSLKAETIFDLQEQYFENAYKQYTNQSLYDLKNVQVVMTNMYQANTGEYLTSNGQRGKMQFKLKSPLENFAVILDILAKSVYTDNNQVMMIIFKNTNGIQKVISLTNRKELVIDGKKFEIKDLYNTPLNIAFNKKDDIVEFILNGQTFVKSESKEFASLESIEFLLGQEKGYADLLYSLSIIKK